jgi:predicted RNase H-like nuclease (RuvC/YqgF family)
MSRILGIDPGCKTGLALFVDGKLVELSTTTPQHLAAAIRVAAPARVIYEDSRLTSAVFARNVSPAAMRKIARNVGIVDGICAQIVSICETLGVPAHGISPKGKGKKLGAVAFAQRTSWTGRSNQHERDATTVAWPYRGAA